VALAWQCRQVGDVPLADNLLALALDGTDEDRLATTLAAVAYLRDAGQLDRADGLLGQLSAAEAHAHDPGLWRLRAALAEQRGLEARAVEDLEHALDLEYQRLPEVIDLPAWRRDYGKLLTQYKALAAAA